MMHLALTLFLSVAVNGAAIQLEPRQINVLSSLGSFVFDTATGLATGVANGLVSGVATTMLAKQKTFRIEEVKATHPGAKRIKLIYGPYKLKAANSSTKIGNSVSLDKGGTAYLNLVDYDFPKDITVLEAYSEVQDEKFQRSDTKSGIYNHHNVFVDINKSPKTVYTCKSTYPKKDVPFTVFMGGATETGGVRYVSTKEDIKTGYYISRDRMIMNAIDVVNYNNEEKIVYTSSEIEYMPGKPKNYIDTVQQLIDPSICGGPRGSDIRPPKGVQKFSVNGTGILIARDGYIVNMRGHLHDGGVNLLLKINDKIVCDSKATYGGEGHETQTADGKIWKTIRETSECDQPVKVFKGDTVYMQANYDLDLYPSREGVDGHGGMGGMGGMGKAVNNVRAANDGGADEGAEQMALFVTYFAGTT